MSISLVAAACPCSSLVSQPLALGQTGTGWAGFSCTWTARRGPAQAEMSPRGLGDSFGVEGESARPGLRSAAPGAVQGGMSRSGEFEGRMRKRRKEDNGWWRDIGKFSEALRVFQEENGLGTDSIPPETFLRGREGGELTFQSPMPVQWIHPACLLSLSCALLGSAPFPSCLSSPSPIPCAESRLLHTTQFIFTP